MTKRHRSFAAKATKERTDDEKITFDIAEKHYFTAKDDIQGAVILDFVAAADEGAAKAAAKIFGFFEQCLPADEYKRFNEVVHGDDVIVEMETLSEIVAYLIEEYTDRPTQASDSSDAGQ